MSKDPSLSELGLDDDLSPTSKPLPERGRCRICGSTVALREVECSSCKEIRASSSTAHQSTNTTHVYQNRTEPRIVALIDRAVAMIPVVGSILVVTVIGFFVFALSNSANDQSSSPMPSNASTIEPTYCDALQVLVDELDSSLQADIFGTVTCDGRHAYVVLEAAYFVRLEPEAERTLLTGVRDQWVTKCFGKNVTFKTWDGSIVAEL